ncbi:YARHG domain-containing protein [Aquimarina sp. RZ0]|uniref:YARHG domain-containing protein n=1 Tax=Aquimarina sp. RZ0 TaxID=2607730 RepID=UPI0011F153BF|nr:YARHG domain-containing protein [Aquimarina sp. RZ0]KAA1244033.1 YARHG domain-containing protein [Aquimarina sp. RZ0]
MKNFLLFLLLCVFLSCKGQNGTTEQTDQIATSFQFLSEEVLKTKNKEELRLIRNEVFARKGYVFKSEDLNTYYKTKSWYTPNTSVKVTLSDEEQNYIDKIKTLEGQFNLKGNKNCLYYFGLDNLDFFPLTSDKFLTHKYSNDLDKIKLEELNEVVEGNLCGGGTVWDIMYYENIKYQLMFYTCDSDNLYLKMAILDDNEIKDFIQLYGSSTALYGDAVTSGYHDIDFKLDKDDLEVYKIFKVWDEENSTEENMYPVKEVRREVSKYKLTDQGLVEL